jgi:NADH-quinone oxidoreductase subunit G
LNLPGFEYNSSQEVLEHLHATDGGAIPQHVPAGRLSNGVAAGSTVHSAQAEPCVAGIYQLDGIVRRATALQLTADARATRSLEVTA